ncbi:MAG TPA: type II secretion system minor pseudopilin GspK, partial [Casimicrobiaceae bacterium]
MKGQRGLALIVAMLIAALAAAVAVSLAAAQSQWSAQVSHRRDQVQAQSIALAGIQWARQILDADARAGPIDHLGEPWALPLPATPVENGIVEGRIVDAQGLLNVNNLASTTRATSERRRFERLFAALGIPETTLAAIVDWVDADDAAQPGGAEDAWYLAQADPALAPNAPASRIEELSFARGMTPPAMTSVARFVTSLPVDTPLNLNTAPAEVLAATIDDVEPGALAALIASRAQHPFASLADFRERLPAGASIGQE